MQHVLCRYGKAQDPTQPPAHPRRSQRVPPRSSNLNTFTAHESALGAAVSGGKSWIFAGGSLYRVYHVCACEYHTYKWKKDGPGRPSPAANPLIYRLRVSACIRRLGHMPSLPPRFFSRLLSSASASFPSIYPYVFFCYPPRQRRNVSRTPRESSLYEFTGRDRTTLREPTSDTPPAPLL